MNKDILEIIRNSRFDRNALNRQADRTGSGRVAVEKDFVISVILLLIAELPEFSRYSNKLVFRGGTCIKKVFYPDETRFSEDLDFMDLTQEGSKSFLEAMNGLIGRNLGVTTFDRTEPEYQNARGLDFILYYTSVLQQRNHITFNLSTASPIERSSRMKAHLTPYFSESPTVFTLGINEIVAEKMRALLQRRKPRDVFDAWFLMEKKGIKLDTVLLRKKLQRSYDAASFGNKRAAGSYAMSDIASEVRQSVTERAWNNELGGLMIRLRPERRVVIDSVCRILSGIGDISLR